MQTITTKYLGWTKTKCERVKATTSSGISKTISWDYKLNSDQNHIEAVKQLNKRLNWGGEMAYGPHGKGDGFTFVRTRNTINLIQEVKK